MVSIQILTEANAKPLNMKNLAKLTLNCKNIESKQMLTLNHMQNIWSLFRVGNIPDRSRKFFLPPVFLSSFRAEATRFSSDSSVPAPSSAPLASSMASWDSEDWQVIGQIRPSACNSENRRKTWKGWWEVNGCRRRRKQTVLEPSGLWEHSD